MNEDETKRRIDMIRLKLRGIAADIRTVGELSGHLYQAKCDRYANKMNELAAAILEDKMSDMK